MNLKKIIALSSVVAVLSMPISTLASETNQVNTNKTLSQVKPPSKVIDVNNSYWDYENEQNGTRIFLSRQFVDGMKSYYPTLASYPGATGKNALKEVLVKFGLDPTVAEWISSVAGDSKASSTYDIILEEYNNLGVFIDIDYAHTYFMMIDGAWVMRN